MKRTVIIAATLVATAFATTSAGATGTTPDRPHSKCNTWRNGTTQQCTAVYHTDGNIRFKMYVDGEWVVTLTYFPPKNGQAARVITNK